MRNCHYTFETRKQSCISGSSVSSTFMRGTECVYLFSIKKEHVLIDEVIKNTFHV